MNCNCLCVMNHPDARGVCTASADTSLRFCGNYIGEVDVDMCSACAAATLADGQPELVTPDRTC